MVLGFKCFRAYFESVNAYEHKIKRTGQSIVVEKQDLTGLSYLWQIVLETPYEDIAEDAAQYLIQLSYTLLSPRLKKVFDPVWCFVVAIMSLSREMDHTVAFCWRENVI